MEEINDLTLQRLSKRYSNASTKNWENPSPEVVLAVEKVLQINKSRALEPLARSKRLNNLDAHISVFIEEFSSRLSRAKLPKNLDSRDFDHDYQLKREAFLQDLCSKELSMVENLEDTLNDEEVELKELTKYVKTYDKLYRDELRKLEEFEGSDLVKKVRRHEQNEVKSLDLTYNDEEMDEFLDELGLHLAKLDDRFEPLQELSKKLEVVIESLST